MLGQGVVGGLVGGGITPFNTLGDAFVLGLVLACVSPVGDFSESMIKRDLDLKDMGTLLPGHGGVLDRIDALLPTLPLAMMLATALPAFPA